MTTRPIRLLTFTNLFPNAHQPAHGLFVKRRLQRLIATGAVDAEVMAPVPFRWSGPSRWVDAVERQDGLTVHHPTFVSVPGLGRFVAPFSMLFASWRRARALARRASVDIVDAHYFYPDAVAAAAIAWGLRKPLVVTARGTDVNVLPNYFFSRWLIRWTARRAAKIVTVSDALRTRLIALGVAAGKIETLRNGVDADEFRPRDRAEARARLGLPDALTLLSVGNLVESKGHHLVIEALCELPQARLVIAGDGPMRAALVRTANRLGVGDRVRFAGVLTPDELIDYYSAADALTLATLREGMPNVVLEAISCGLPVVATDCGGIAEIVDRPECGVLMAERSSAAVVAAVRHLQANYPSRADTRAAARRFDWRCTIERQVALYRAVAESPS